MTEVHYLEECEDNLIYIKRDDLLPMSFGGNKARKAINFFQDIDTGGNDSVVTYGSGSSNHGRIIANMAAMRGIGCYIISPSEASRPTFNSRMMKLFGAEITVVPVESVHQTIEEKLRELKRQGRKPYFIAGGGHGNLGTQAYVDCYEEIVKYEEDNRMFFDYIFFASGTGTTQAGLVCGQLFHNDSRCIVGISIARKKTQGQKIVMDSIYEYLETRKVPINESVVKAATVFDDSYRGDGYGKSNLKIRLTVREMLLKYGIPMDFTYTGKAYAGMKDYIQKNRIRGKNILFLHTGGTPLFFDDLLNEDI